VEVNGCGRMGNVEWEGRGRGGWIGKVKSETKGEGRRGRGGSKGGRQRKTGGGKGVES